jgi:dipeptidyl-peptidase-4
MDNARSQPHALDRYRRDAHSSNERALSGDEQRLKRFHRYLNPAGLVAGGDVAPQWMLDGSSFWFAENAPYATVIYRVDGATGELSRLFDVAKTRAALRSVIGRDPPYEGLPFDHIVELGGSRYQFTFEAAQYTIDLDSYEIETAVGSSLSQGMQMVWKVMGENLDKSQPKTYRRQLWLTEPRLVFEVRSPDGEWFVGLQDGNIVLRSFADDRTVALTTDGAPEFAWDVEAPRLRFAPSGRLAYHLLNPWSPDGCRLFAIKVDRRGVPDLPMIRYLKREEELCTLKIQRAGGRIDVAHPHIVDVLSKQARPLDLGSTEDQYFTLVGWLPDGSEVLFTRHSRDFKSVDLLAADADTGELRTVLSEHSKTFVALQHDVIFGGDNHVCILPSGAGLIWRSSRSGWNHLYLYGRDGTLLHPLTAGDFAVIDVVSVDEPGGSVYFTAHHDPDRPYDTHVCRVSVNGGEIQRLSAHSGQNMPCFSPSKKRLTIVNSKPEQPYRTFFFSTEGQCLSTLRTADTSVLEDVGYVPASEFKVLAADKKTELWGVMYKPADFDPRKKYPIIDHIYAGPQVRMACHHFGFDEHSSQRLSRALAQLGYIVISLDARGTPGRSKEFEDAVYRNFGRHEIPDHAAAIVQLARRHSFIDAERVGIYGHSWGGHFAVRALADAPDVFSVAVASAPSVDPHEMMLYEPYLDLPTRARSAYEFASLYPSVGKIKGKLLLAAGTADPMVSATLRLVHRLIEAGIDHDLVILPDARHTYLGKDEAFFVRRLVAHFEMHLKRPSSSPLTSRASS